MIFSGTMHIMLLGIMYIILGSLARFLLLDQAVLPERMKWMTHKPWKGIFTILWPIVFITGFFFMLWFFLSSFRGSFWGK